MIQLLKKIPSGKKGSSVIFTAAGIASQFENFPEVNHSFCFKAYNINRSHIFPFQEISIPTDKNETMLQ